MFHFPAAQDGVGIGVATIFKKMCRILSFLQERGGIFSRDRPNSCRHQELWKSG